MNVNSICKNVKKGIILKALAASSAWHEPYLKGWAFDLMLGDSRVEIGPMRMSGYCMGAYTALCGHMSEPMPEITAKELGRAYKISRKLA